jgi:hypothetical protein
MGDVLGNNIYNPGQQDTVKNIHDLLKNDIPLFDVAETIVEGTFLGHDIERKDSLDRFLDYVVYKVRTGVPYIPSLAYPTMQIEDPEIESKCIELINDFLIPEIIIKVLKYFSRNVQQADTSLYLANLITNEVIIQSVFDTFKTFRRDIYETDRERKTLNVKRLQQFSAHTDNRFSSPLDAAARFKYVLEYLYLIRPIQHMFTLDELSLSQ